MLDIFFHNSTKNIIEEIHGSVYSTGENDFLVRTHDKNGKMIVFNGKSNTYKEFWNNIVEKSLVDIKHYGEFIV